MVFINEYKGHTIKYDSNSLFWVDMDGFKRLQLESEVEARKYIDEQIMEKERESKEEKELQELKEVPEFKIAIAEPSYLKNSIAIIKELANEGQFVFDKEKINLEVIDPANVAMVVWKLLSSCCIEYNVPKRFGIALNLRNFYEILNRASKDDIIVLEKGEKDQLKISLKGISKRIFRLPFIDLDWRTIKVPKLIHNTTIKMQSKLFQQQVLDCSRIAERLKFSVQGNKFIIDAESDLSKYSAENQPNNDLTIESKDSPLSKYSVEYLKKMIKSVKISDMVTLKFSKDYPLKLEYDLKDKLSMMFILAPIVEND